jgi:hypothetical protein
VKFFKLAAMAAIALTLLVVVGEPVDAEQQTGDDWVLVNVYTTACTEVADIDGCYDVYLCNGYPSYNEAIASPVVERCTRVMQDVRGERPNPSVPAVTPDVDEDHEHDPVVDPPVILFTG